MGAITQATEHMNNQLYCCISSICDTHTHTVTRLVKNLQFTATFFF